MSSPSFSEKTLTEWYYSIRGDASRRGLVNEVILSKMATEGNLKPEDLVWNKAQGERWVLASSVPGLFSEHLLAKDLVEEVDDRTLDNIPISKRHRSSLPLLLIVGAILIGTASWFSQRLYLEETGLPEPVARVLGLEIVEGTIPDIKLHTNLINLYLNKESIAKAKELIIQLSEEEEYASEAQAYRNRLQALQKTIEQRKILQQSVGLASKYLDGEDLEKADPLIARLAASREYKTEAAALEKRAADLRAEFNHRKQLRDTLRQGKVDRAKARELVEVYQKKKKYNELLTVLEKVLQSRSKLPPRACLAVAHAYLVLEKPTHAQVALQHFVERSKHEGPEQDFLEAAALFHEVGDPAPAAAMLNSFVKKNPESAHAWLELAGILAASGDTKTPIIGLKQAIKHGGNPIRLKALGDKRFQPLRETWTFKRLTKIDE